MLAIFLDSGRGFRACVLALRCTKVSSILLCGRCLSTSLLTITQKDYNEPQVRYLKSKQASEKTKADEWTASAAVLYCNIYSSNLILSYIHLPVTIISHKLTNPRYLRTVVQLSRGRVWVRPWKANFALSSSPNRSL